MRINKYLAQNTGLSRRKADEAIKNGSVLIDGVIATLGNEVKPKSVILLNGVEIKPKNNDTQILLVDKPVGYVCSRDGQGSPTVYDLVDAKYKDFNIAGRLDKDSSGLVILTNDGELLNELTHPSNNKEKVYEVTIDKELNDEETDLLIKGVDIGDERPSRFTNIEKVAPKKYRVILNEGRNRQIRRTFDALNARVILLHRTAIGPYRIDDII